MSKQTNSNIDRQIRSIKLKADLSKVTISFVDVVDAESTEGEEDSTVIDTKYTAKSKHKPHKDFVASMRKLLKHALASCEIEIDNLKNYSVLGLNITGDLFMNQSRVVMILAKRVERTEDVIEWSSPQITLSDESKYQEWKDLQKLVKLVFDEVWLYLQGKHDGDNLQLAFTFDIPEKKAKKKKEKEPEAEASQQQEPDAQMQLAQA